MYRLIAIDIDDTLMDSQGRITPATRAALAEAAARGIIITLATGRMFASARNVAADLGLDVPLITYQGSLVKHASSGDVLYERTVPPDAAQAVYDHCRQHGLHLQAYVDDRLIVPEDNAKVRAYSANSAVPFEVAADFAAVIRRPQTKLLIIDEPDVLDGRPRPFSSGLFGGTGADHQVETALSGIHPSGRDERAMRSGFWRPISAFRPKRRWRSATAGTTATCWRRRGLPSPWATPSRS